MIDGPDFEKVTFEDLIPIENETTRNLPREILSHKLARLSKAVALLDNGKKPATGFLIAPNLLMTNWHVFEKASWANGAIARFGYLESDPDTEDYEIDPDIFFHNNKDLDYAVVGVSGEPGDEHKWGVISIPQKSIQETPKHVIIIQHPQGRTQEIVFKNNEVVQIDERIIRYKADTEYGSSGSPVFNENFDLVALHHGYDKKNGFSKRGISDFSYSSRFSRSTNAASIQSKFLT